MAVGIYFALQLYVGTEEIGWMCILGAAPFAACGFFTYHGMTAEQVLWAWFKSEILCPKRLVFKSDSYYYEAMQPAIRAGNIVPFTNSFPKDTKLYKLMSTNPSEKKE